MKENLNIIEFGDIEKEVTSKNKIHKYIKIIPIISIIITSIIILITIISLMNNNEKNQEKEKENENDREDKKEDQKEKEDPKDEDIDIDTCETGENDKCLTCENNLCTSCNYKFELINGTCVANFSIKAKYVTNEFDENVDLISSMFLNNIINMEIDKEEVEPCAEYTFKTKGEHTVYIDMDVSNLELLISMFSLIEKLTSVFFSKNFDIQKVKDMKGFFYGCTKLT